MEQARTAANEDKVSINQLLLSFISEGLGLRKGLKMMRERAARGDPERALAVLESLRGPPPEPGDEMPGDGDWAAFERIMTRKTSEPPREGDEIPEGHKRERK
jgi:hypothetical protein